MNMNMNSGEAFNLDDDFYAEYEEEYTESWCVFGNQSGFCYATLSTEDDAQEEASRLLSARKNMLQRRQIKCQLN